ncbi:MAG: tetratricopeptide repeat protein [Candidatus Solibacter sp.]
MSCSPSRWDVTSCAALLTVGLAVLSSGCIRQPTGGAIAPDRLAIVRFENLSSDDSLTWQGRAMSEVVATCLSGAGNPKVISSAGIHLMDRLLGVRSFLAPGISSESNQALAAGATQLAYGNYTVRNGRLEVDLTIEDARTMKVLRTARVTVAAGDVLGAATQLARTISSKAGAYSTRSPQALEAYTKALEASDPAVIEIAAGAAIAADPSFVAPYRLKAQLKIQRQDRAGAAAELEQALARAGALPELDRTRLELEIAELSGNTEARLGALNKLVKLDGGDVNVWRSLGDSLMNRHDFKQAQQAYQRASELEPDDVGLLNSTGYAAGQAGDFDVALAALKRYGELRPKEANPHDSTGDVQMVAGRLSEAEASYLEAARKDPNFQNHGPLIKAALAHLLTGDVNGANALADRYLAAQAASKDLVVEYRRAQWTWISGRRKAAAQQMGAFALANEGGPLREVASRAYSELAIWSLMFGDRTGAASLAQKALSLAGASSAGNALVARFLTLPPASSSEWAVRAEQQFPGAQQTAIKNFSLAYALLLNQEFQPALLLLRQMWENGTPTADEGLPVMLAWCYLETGRVKEASALLRGNPVPSSNGLTPYTAFYIPRLLYLRGVLAEKEGRASDARDAYQKFLTLSGPDPLMWGEEKKARQ